MNHSVTKTVVVQVQNVLDNRVSIRILHGSECIVGDFIDELGALMIRGMVDARLQNTTAVTMSSNFNTVCRNGVINELRMSVSNEPGNSTVAD